MQTISEIRKVLIHHAPRRHFSRLLLEWSRLRLPSPVNRLQNTLFARITRLDVSEAELKLQHYPTLNSFFTRRLHASARPVDPDPESIIFPCDGKTGALGNIRHDTLVQAKGIEYPLFPLLYDETRARLFEDGFFCTIYLSPRDYHRVHFPMDGRVTHVAHIPGLSGTSFPVGDFCTRHIERLYCRNERVVTYVETPHGTMAVVMVAATGVGNMTLSCLPEVPPQEARTEHTRQDVSIPVEKGGECGIFHMGSTVICLFEKGNWNFRNLEEGRFVRFGRVMGRI